MITSKIKKLLAIAENVPGTPEAVTAAAIALKLMKQHAVAQSDLAECDVDPIEHAIMPSTNTALWRRSLIEVVAQHCSCSSLFVQGQVRVYGHTTELAAALFLIGLLEAQITAEGWGYVDSRLTPATHSDVNRFLCSAVSRVQSRLRALHQVDTAMVGTGLALARGYAVSAFVQARWQPAPGSYSLEGHRAGYAAGDRIRLGLKEVT